MPFILNFAQGEMAMTAEQHNECSVKIGCESLVRTGMIPATADGFSVRQGDCVLYPVLRNRVLDITKLRLNNESEQVPTWVRRHCEIYNRKKSVRVLILSKLPYTLTCARAGASVPPLLDDFAQLVGVNARVVRGDMENAAFSGSIIKGLVWRNAVLIGETGGLCAAVSFDDALAVAQVLEKNCRAVVDTFFLGGGYPINILESWLMRLVYRYKYSKKMAA